MQVQVLFPAYEKTAILGGFLMLISRYTAVCTAVGLFLRCNYPAKHGIEPRRVLLLSVLHGVAVGVQGKGGSMVAEVVLHCFHIISAAQRVHCVGMPQIMET